MGSLERFINLFLNSIKMAVYPSSTISIGITIYFMLYLSIHSLKALSIMASLGNTSPTYNQSFLFDQIPLLDLFFPGLTPTTSLT